MQRLIDVYLMNRPTPIRFRLTEEVVLVTLEALRDPDAVLLLPRDGFETTAIPVRSVFYIDLVAKRDGATA